VVITGQACAALAGDASRWASEMDAPYKLYKGDCRDFLPLQFDAVITDPPYPNTSGHFESAIQAARDVIKSIDVNILLCFWSELEIPETKLPLVAVHIWHRTNVNGKIYEPVFHFAKDGIKRRSEIIKGAAVFQGAGAGCIEYAGHPTQKPKHVMRWLIQKYTKPDEIVFDPFMGSGTTGVAALQLGRKFIGCEIDPKYFAIAEKRIKQAAQQPALLHEAQQTLAPDAGKAAAQNTLFE